MDLLDKSDEAISEREFMGTTRQQDYVNFYWKQRLSLTEDEALAILTLSQEEGRYLVERARIHFWQPKRLQGTVGRFVPPGLIVGPIELKGAEYEDSSIRRHGTGN